MSKSTNGTRNVLFTMLGLAALAGGAAVVMTSDPQASPPGVAPAAASYVGEETIELTADKPWRDQTVGEGPFKLNFVVKDPGAIRIGLSCLTSCKMFLEDGTKIELKNGGVGQIPLPAALSDEPRQHVATVETPTNLYFRLNYPEDQ